MEHKVEIEEELGFLEWQPIEGRKSSRIRKTLGVDILKEENIERAVKLQIKTAEDFKKVLLISNLKNRQELLLPVCR